MGEEVAIITHSISDGTRRDDVVVPVTDLVSVATMEVLCSDPLIWKHVARPLADP
jgi:predicted subunit of tRNA(5-methylaminomethyl-2-thiouridylate) methyltransferase